MQSEALHHAIRNRTQRIAEEMDHLFQRQIELMKSETFFGLTPAERQEYDKITGRISGLFRELAKLK